MMLVIATQYFENYAAHDWDGVGVCPQGWKAKGGAEYKVTDIPFDLDDEVIVSMVQPLVEKDNDYVRETIIGWSKESDDYMSWFEKSQLEYDGVITFKEPCIKLSEINSWKS